MSYRACYIISTVKAPGYKETVLKTKSKTRKEKDKVTQLLSALRFVLLDKDGKCIVVMCIYGTNSCLFSLQDDDTVKSVLDDLLSGLKIYHGHYFLHAITILKIKDLKRGAT